VFRLGFALGRGVVSRRKFDAMSGHLRRYRAAGWALLALLGWALAPATAAAGNLYFRNDTDGTVIVQGISSIGPQIIRGRVHRLAPGEVCWDLILTPGNKLILIADGKKPTQILYQNTIQLTGRDMVLSIQKDTPPAPKPGEKAPAKPAAPKVKLVPTNLSSLGTRGTTGSTPRPMPRR
jgi:hypothetical protein